MNNQHHLQPGAISSRPSLYDAAVNLLAARHRKQAAYADLDKANQVMQQAEKDLIAAYLAEGGDEFGTDSLVFKAPHGTQYLITLDSEEMVINSVQEVFSIFPRSMQGLAQGEGQ